MEIQQQLVNDPVCEQAIISILLTTENLYADAAEIISHEMFYNPKCEVVFKSIAQIYSHGDSPNLINVGKWLAENEPKAGIDTMALMDITSTFYTSVNLRDHCHRLRELWQRRLLWQVGQKLVGVGLSETCPVDEAKHDAVETIADIDKHDSSNILSAATVLDNLCDIVENNRLGKHRKGITTGFRLLDSKGGLQRSDLVVVAAEFSQGKTSLAIDLCVKAANNGHPCVFYSTEMTNDQLMARIMAGQCGVSSRVILQEPLDSKQKEMFDLAAQITRPLPVYFDDTATISIERIIVSIRRMVIKHHIEIAFIDYLQVLQTNENGWRQNEEQFFGSVARKLKNLAKELNICIVLLSQLSRDKNTTEPTLSRLRGSGQIAEAADMVLLIYRPEMYDKGYSGDNHKVRPEGTALVRLAKGRNVGTGEFICGYDAPTTHFYELDHIPTTDEPYNSQIDNDRPF